jgi:hypothetical protein
MSNKAPFTACVFAALITGPAFAENTFQNSCSEIHFAYSGNQPTLKAVCVKPDGTANPSTLPLQGISNQNGILTRRGGPSNFHQTCGNIEIIIAGPNTTLSAICKTNNGSANSTSLSLDNIRNNNGNLSQ